ncbi:hypothetical protein WS70_21610 [Burkholderia mayonis]|uniref:Uncharacterized protein n=1 Tax=Burkholderia mayonis TaxID=1385591 RepID=A0A1B4FL89_9BURK|nr:hypothetical protein WS70_21610 [Burkholderia mayonis]KVE37821.1 hypothetical protein WS69_10100 [Burkholderia sp. BDU5]KVE41167.1 hypothetical protein WS70_15360 [Burkholderia mayonis]
MPLHFDRACNADPSADASCEVRSIIADFPSNTKQMRARGTRACSCLSGGGVRACFGTIGCALRDASRHPAEFGRCATALRLTE